MCSVTGTAIQHVGVRRDSTFMMALFALATGLSCLPLRPAQVALNCYDEGKEIPHQPGTPPMLPSPLPFKPALPLANAVRRAPLPPPPPKKTTAAPSPLDRLSAGGSASARASTTAAATTTTTTAAATTAAPLARDAKLDDAAATTTTTTATAVTAVTAAAVAPGIAQADDGRRAPVPATGPLDAQAVEQVAAAGATRPGGRGSAGAAADQHDAELAAAAPDDALVVAHCFLGGAGERRLCWRCFFCLFVIVIVLFCLLGVVGVERG